VAQFAVPVGADHLFQDGGAALGVDGVGGGPIGDPDVQPSWVAGDPLPGPPAKVAAVRYQKAEPTEPAEGGDWLTGRMRCKDAEADKSRELSQTLTGESVNLGEPAADFRFAAAVATFGQLLRNSDKRDITDTLRCVPWRRTPSTTTAAAMAEFLTLVETAERFAAERAAKKRGRE
jgi:hypothetical protein